jgi:NAD(P)-dependent dehydrogenase (short-subunit alcohol dehydrogenase family)
MAGTASTPHQVAVVGASGVIGQAVTRHFATRSAWSVTAISRRTPLNCPGAGLLGLELLDPEACRRAIATLGDVTHLVYCAVQERPGLVGGWHEQSHVDTNAAMLRNLLEPLLPNARLHASRWNDDTLFDVDFLIPLTEERATFLADLTKVATTEFIQRYADRLGEEDAATLREVPDVLVEWQLSRPRPFSLVHGDYRLDNLILHPMGHDVVAVDWQTVTVAMPARDLGYFISTSLPTERHRTEESRLVAEYHMELQARGVDMYPSDQCKADYRRGLIHGPMITVLGSMTSAGARDEAIDAES